MQPYRVSSRSVLPSCNPCNSRDALGRISGLAKHLEINCLIHYLFRLFTQTFCRFVLQSTGKTLFGRALPCQQSSIQFFLYLFIYFFNKHTHCAHLSFARVQLLPQQRLKAVTLVQKVKDVGHLVVPGDACQQTHLRSRQAQEEQKQRGGEQVRVGTS